MSEFLSIQEYREILGDQKSPGEIIEKRLNFIESLCGNVIRQELTKYQDSKKRE